MRNSIVTLTLTVALVLAVVVSASARDARPIAILQSDASFQEKAEACRSLSQNGDREAIPVLAAMLLDEKFTHMARYALEPMPFPEAGAALRDALGKTGGNLKVGIISSLGIRKDEQAVPALIELLSGGDSAVAQAAAQSLGAIGGHDAVTSLKAALDKPDLSLDGRQALCNALLDCAEKLALKESKDERNQAAAIYDSLLPNAALPKPVRAAALRGLILCHGSAPWAGDGSDAVPPLLEALRGDDKDLFAAALRSSRELSKGDKVTAALAELLPTLPAEKKIPLIQALAERGGEAAAPALLTEAKEGPEEVRVAALCALTRLGYAPALDTVMQIAQTGDGELAKTAKNSLSYFPGEAKTGSLRAMLVAEKPETRRLAVELIGRGGLDNPANILMTVAETDADDSVRSAALDATRDCAGMEEMPRLLNTLLNARSASEMQAAEKALQALGTRQRHAPTGSIVIQKAVYGDLPNGPSADVTEKVARVVESGALTVDANNGNFGDTAPGAVKRLQIDYTENGTAVNKTVTEGETLKLATVSTPAGVVDAFCAAMAQAQGEARPAVLRLLASTGSPKALDAVRAAASAEGPLKEIALRTLCEWPGPEALPVVLELLKTASDPSLEVLALRGAVQMLGQCPATSAEVLANFTLLLEHARTAEDKKMVLSGLAKVPQAGAFELALGQFSDDAVKAEAVQAAFAIAKNFGKTAKEDPALFNGKDLTGWQGNTKYWRLEDGALIGGGAEPIAQNEFLWSGIEVRDFYLAVDIQLEPNSGNGGVQFRSKKVDERGQALGYQADVGQEVWGRLYHEHGRGKLDWTDRAEQAVQPGQWNHYEILAIGPAIWTAINGKLGVACLDLAPDAERSGLMALQVHAGAPQTVRYRLLKLIHDPKMELAGLGALDLLNALAVQGK